MICGCTARSLVSRHLTLLTAVNGQPYSVQKRSSDSSWLFTHSSIQIPSEVNDVNVRAATRIHTSTPLGKVSADAAKYVQQPTWVEWWKQKLFQRGRVGKHQLGRSALGLCTKATHEVDVVEWFRVFDMPDTFYSWWLITELHVWMLAVRARVGATPEGDQLVTVMAESLWEDLEQRMKKIPGFARSKRIDQIWDLAEEFQTAMILYDYGTLVDDVALANALWKRFFLADEETDPKKVELLVKYVRKTLAHLDEVNFDDITRGDTTQEKISWFPLDKVSKDA